MATYILLANFTDQGIRKIKDSPKRAEAFKDMAKSAERQSQKYGIIVV